MVGISAQVSLYPIDQSDWAPQIDRAIEYFRRQEGIEVTVGSLSTVLVGDDKAVLDAVRAAFQQAAEAGPAVMVVTLTNASPS
jgi:uncharacterized protein YqgV (UPF0045/DUF77 family)